MIGAYLLTDRDGQPLYAGSSRSVARRVREHKRGEWGGEITLVETFPAECWRDALRTERCLIKDLAPKYNRQGLDPLETATTLAEFAAALVVEVAS